MTAEIRIAIPGRPYSAWVGEGLLEQAAGMIPVPAGAEAIAIVADASALALHGPRLRAGLAGAGLRIEEFALPPGEAAKSFATVEAITRWLAASGVRRGDVLVAFGGGVAGDVAGFASAVYHRGIRVVQCPTTVLAQVDAAIGGKTAVNLPEGKNLAGAFHQPSAVLCDVSTLATLSEGEFASGMAEVVKHGLIADPRILEILESELAAIAKRDVAVLSEVIARAVSVKAAVVSRDETEQGERAHLNYGHTLGHALEAFGGYTRWRHGEAVAIGMMFAAHLGARLGSQDLVGAHRRALESLGLPTHPGDAPFDALRPLLARDKKYRGGVRWILLDDLARPRIAEGVADEDLQAAYEALA